MKGDLDDSSSPSLLLTKSRSLVGISFQKYPGTYKKVEPLTLTLQPQLFYLTIIISK